MRILKIGGGVISHLESLGEHIRGEIIVHGASDYVNALCHEAGVEIIRLKSVSGVEFRYTPLHILPYYIMGVMRANKEIVAYMQKIGRNAIGLSGVDGRIVEARRKSHIRVIINGKKRVIRDDYSGKIERINRELIEKIMELAIPVIGALAIGEENIPLNVDGDTLAVRIAEAFRADELIFLSETAFMRDGHVVERIRQEDLDEYIRMSHGGMRRKLMMIKESLNGGVEEVIIQGLNGRTVIE
ncbi:MAG: [LysW]-aminoadipate/[LysW]-glutamate kinase [Thermoplasmata archaeon]|nr:[LysW]-aminoadipate/[LysW]-glutamate kinase [Thermoplasmata archaeon]